MNRRGFTLVELLVAIALASIVLTVLANAMQTQGRSAIFQTGTADMQQNVRSALDLFRRELRMVGYGMNEIQPDVLAAIEVPVSADQYAVNLRANYENVDSRGSASAGSTTIVLDAAEAPFPVFRPGERVAIESGILAVAEVRVISTYAQNTGVMTVTGGTFVNAYEPGSFVRQINEIQYRLDADNLFWRGTEVIADQMDLLDLVYILSDGTEVDDPVGSLPELRAASVSMHAEKVEHDGLKPQADLDTEVRIRNLGIVRDAT
jgi:prepilin-type N-terminal cleavage/methylation domain-containing protein